MKTTIKTLALALFATMSATAFAGTNAEKAVSAELNVQIKEMSDNKVLVVFEKQEGELVTVKIYDTYGVLLHSDKDVKSTLYNKRFDLSALPAGKYSYEVSNDVYSIKKVIVKN